MCDFSVYTDTWQQVALSPGDDRHVHAVFRNLFWFYSGNTICYNMLQLYLIVIQISLGLTFCGLQWVEIATSRPTAKNKKWN